MTRWSEDFSYVELKSVMKWEEPWDHIDENLEDVDLHKYLSMYDTMPALLREYGSDFKFYDLILAQEVLWVHLGAVDIVEEEISVDASVDSNALLEEAKDKICETIRTDIGRLKEQFRRVDRLWKSLYLLRHEDDNYMKIQKIVGVERGLSILRLEAETDPWSKVQEQFSFGTRSNSAVP